MLPQPSLRSARCTCAGDAMGRSRSRAVAGAGRGPPRTRRLSQRAEARRRDARTSRKLRTLIADTFTHTHASGRIDDKEAHIIALAGAAIRRSRPASMPRRFGAPARSGHGDPDRPHPAPEPGRQQTLRFPLDSGVHEGFRPLAARRQPGHMVQPEKWAGSGRNFLTFRPGGFKSGRNLEKAFFSTRRPVP